MTSRLSKLVLAAALAGAIPAAASAHDRDRDGDRDRPPVAVAPAPWYPAPPPVREGWRPERRDPERAWRARELASVRGELRALDAERAEFHARHAWRPGQLRRYDRDYLARRAALERRLRALELVAWR